MPPPRMISFRTLTNAKVSAEASVQRTPKVVVVVVVASDASDVASEELFSCGRATSKFRFSFPVALLLHRCVLCRMLAITYENGCTEAQRNDDPENMGCRARWLRIEGVKTTASAIELTSSTTCQKTRFSPSK